MNQSVHSMDFFEMKAQIKTMDTEKLFDWQRAVESELEVRGAVVSFQEPPSGTFIGQGIYTIGEHIPAGTYSFYLPQFISREASSSSYLYLFANQDEYEQHLQKNNGRLGTIATFSVYRNSPVSCLTLTQGQILAIKYNGVKICKFLLEL